MLFRIDKEFESWLAGQIDSKGRGIQNKVNGRSFPWPNGRPNCEFARLGGGVAPEKIEMT
jgi:hypothetical protein